MLKNDQFVLETRRSVFDRTLCKGRKINYVIVTFIVLTLGFILLFTSENYICGLVMGCSRNE